MLGFEQSFAFEASKGNANYQVATTFPSACMCNPLPDFHLIASRRIPFENSCISSAPGLFKTAEPSSSSPPPPRGSNPLNL